jgi:hypothetical protein
MAQSAFLLHKLHGGAPLARRIHGGGEAIPASVSRPQALPLPIRPRRARAALCLSARASRIASGAFRRRHGRQPPNRRQSPFSSAWRHLAAQPDKQATRIRRERGLPPCPAYP